MYAQGFIYTDSLSPEIINKLTIRNPKYSYALRSGESLEGIPKNFILYKEVYNIAKRKKLYQIPRYSFGDSKVLPENCKLVCKDKPIDIEFNHNAKDRFGKPVTLNDSQNNTVEKTYETLKKYFGALIEAKTGEGKTLMAIVLITLLKQRTVIFVQKDVMIKQWRDALLYLTNLKKSDIGLLKQGKFKEGKVVIASQQSLMRNTIGREINNLFGLKIQDEVHKIGAKQFLRANTRIQSKYVLSLSATIERDDGLENLFYLHTSKNVIQHETVRTSLAYYRVYEYFTMRDWIYNPYVGSYGKNMLLYNLLKDETRNELIMFIIKNHIHRKMVVTSERIEHLKKLMQMTKERFPQLKVVRFFGAETKRKRVKKAYYDINEGDIIQLGYGTVHEQQCKKGTKLNDTVHVEVLKVNKSKTKIEYYCEEEEVHSKLSIDELMQWDRPERVGEYLKRKWVNKVVQLEEYEDPSFEILDKADIIFATDKKMTDATDIPHLDCMLFATPFGGKVRLKQSKGRIERFFEGKKHPLVIDINDTRYKSAQNLFNKRLRMYKTLGMKKLKIENKFVPKSL